MREYWRGGVEAWECDEMGHMNVRFWIKRALDALVVLAHDLGLPSDVRLVPDDQHIRFLKEAHAGGPLFLRGGILEAGADRLLVYAEIVHSGDGALGATFITQVHPEDLSGARLTLSVETLARIGTIPLPAHGTPRSLPLDQRLPDGTLEAAVRIGFSRVGLSPVRHSEVDETGRLYPEGFIGRISEAVPNLLMGWRHDAAEEASQMDGVTRKAGAAVLEYRMRFHTFPRTGDLVEVRSAVVAVADKTMTLQHWLLDPGTGKPWCITQAIAITFDLIARKAMATPPRARQRLEAMRVSVDI